MSIRTTLFLITILCALNGCEDPQTLPVEITGLKPVYLALEEIEVKSEAPRAFDQLGKIVYIDPILLINEHLKGIHVLDNSNPENPEPIAFWSIPGNVDFTVTGDFLYADNSWNLLVIDITDIQAIQLLSTLENFYQRPQTEQLYPRDYSGFFECVDVSKGIVVEWEEELLLDPKCWR